MKARRFFPNIPEEIFSLWLDDRIKANGWPPTTEIWRNVLRQKPIRFWKNLRWTKESLNLDITDFTPNSIELVRLIIDAAFKGYKNQISEYMGNESVKKLFHIMRYLQDHKQIPNPIILFRSGQLYELVDGCHRISALVHLRETTGVSYVLDGIVAWVGVWTPNLNRMGRTIK